LLSIDFSNCRKLGDNTIFALFPKKESYDPLLDNSHHNDGLQIRQHANGKMEHHRHHHYPDLHKAPSPELSDRAIDLSADTSMDEAQMISNRKTTEDSTDESSGSEDEGTSRLSTKRELANVKRKLNQED